MLLGDLLRLDLNDDQDDERAYLIELLKDVQQAANERVWLAKWWWGTEIERAWALLHEVEQRTVDLLPEEELPARAALASSRGSRFLKDDDKQLKDLDALRQAAKDDPSKSPDGFRSAIVEVLRAAGAQSDGTKQESRYFRNRLLIASVLSVLFAVVIVVVQSHLGDTRLLQPPRDWSGSASVFLVVVMVFGSVGALFTAIPAMANVPADFSPFNLPIQQALLKIVFGPLVAVIGIAILSTGAVGLPAPVTWPALLLFAVVLGAGQQVVTRYVDHRAEAILGATAPSVTKKTT